MTQAQAQAAPLGQVLDRVLCWAGVGLKPSYREYPDEIEMVGNYAIIMAGSSLHCTMPPHPQVTSCN